MEDEAADGLTRVLGDGMTQRATHPVQDGPHTHTFIGGVGPRIVLIKPSESQKRARRGLIRSPTIESERPKDILGFLDGTHAASMRSAAIT